MADSNFNTHNPPKVDKVDADYRSFEYIQQAKAVNDLLYIALTSNERIHPKEDTLYQLSHAIDSLLSQAAAMLEGEVAA